MNIHPVVVFLFLPIYIYIYIYIYICNLKCVSRKKSTDFNYFLLLEVLSASLIDLNTILI